MGIRTRRSSLIRVSQSSSYGRINTVEAAEEDWNYDFVAPVSRLVGVISLQKFVRLAKSLANRGNEGVELFIYAAIHMGVKIC